MIQSYRIQSVTKLRSLNEIIKFISKLFVRFMFEFRCISGIFLIDYPWVYMVHLCSAEVKISLGLTPKSKFSMLLNF